jgi:ribokinase
MFEKPLVNYMCADGGSVMSARVCVVGSANMDLVMRTSALPQPGQTVLGESFAAFPGGKGANQAIAAARTGVNVSFVGCVGDDAFAQTLRTCIEREGIDTSNLHTRPHTPSGVAAIAVAADGQNSIIIAPGANATLTPDDIIAATPRIVGARVLLLQLETPLETVLSAARIARDAGVLVVLNPAPARPLEPAVFELCDVLIPNESEASLLSGLAVHDPATAARAGKALLGQGARSVIITLGSQGAVWVTPESAVHVPAYPVLSIDTTAAGDALCGAYAAARASDVPPNDALYWGMAAGALTTTLAGAQPALPYRLELVTLLRRSPAAANLRGIV